MMFALVCVGVLVYIVIGAVGAGLVFRRTADCDGCRRLYASDRWLGHNPLHSPFGVMVFWPVYIAAASLWYALVRPSWNNIRRIVNVVAGREAT